MIFLKIDSETKVVQSALFDTSYLTEEIKKTGYMTNKDYPQPESIPLKSEVVKYDPDIDEFLVEYVDRPPTPQEKVEMEMELMQTALDDLIMGGMM